MTAVTVWKFDDPEGARRAWKVVKDAEDDGLVRVLDHAVVSWPPDADKPDSDVGHEARWGGAAWGGFLGVMIGMLFLVPVVGGLVGAALGAAAKAMEGTGISRADLQTIREGVRPGTSALFLVTEEADLDRLGERFHGMPWRLMSTNLTEPERKVLVETFGGE